MRFPFVTEAVFSTLYIETICITCIQKYLNAHVYSIAILIRFDAEPFQKPLHLYLQVLQHNVMCPNVIFLLKRLIINT